METHLEIERLKAELDKLRKVVDAAKEYKREYLTGLDDESPKAKMFAALADLDKGEL